MGMPLSRRSAGLEPVHIPEPQDYLCWSKMQAESGQELSAIIERKERERVAGGGLFFWGVGNAPSRAIRSLARLDSPVPVVFSTMKSKPKRIDAHPADVLVWRKYFDLHDVERELPPHVLITSRAHSGVKAKTRHFALMCFSHQPLAMRRGIPFDPAAYRNAGAMGAALGASQVTALIKKIRPFSRSPAYEVNLQAELTGSYWVKLSDPTVMPRHICEFVNGNLPSDNLGWIKFVATLRNGPEAQILSDGLVRLL